MICEVCREAFGVRLSSGLTVCRHCFWNGGTKFFLYIQQRKWT